LEGRQEVSCFWTIKAVFIIAVVAMVFVVDDQIIVVIVLNVSVPFLDFIWVVIEGIVVYLVMTVYLIAMIFRQ
jgi:hypothetical protein